MAVNCREVYHNNVSTHMAQELQYTHLGGSRLHNNEQVEMAARDRFLRQQPHYYGGGTTR
jgi:hypothetical protein